MHVLILGNTKRHFSPGPSSCNTDFSCAVLIRYIGETSRHFSTRIKEHTMSDKNSHILKHFSEFPSCKSLYTPSCFIILDTANNPIDLKLKEALYIDKNKPNLNKQVYHFDTF